MDDGNASRIVRALSEFGFGSRDPSQDDFNRPDSVVQLGHPPHRIDILTEIDGVSFEVAWSRHVDIDIDGIPVPFISREDLIVNKRSGRPQDIADVARLEAEE
jgi:hypothetical protein